MKQIIKEYVLGDIAAVYMTDEHDGAELVICPEKMRNKLELKKPGSVDSLVQISIDGDAASSGFAAGHTYRNSETCMNMKYISQSMIQEKDTVKIVTALESPSGIHAIHEVIYESGREALEVRTAVKNNSSDRLDINMLSSVSIGMLTPFEKDGASGQLRYHRIRSKWSGEGLTESGSIEQLQLEPSWSGHGVSVEKFGQTGSMPVRRFFPFAAVEDTKNRVTWAFQLLCASSWQIEYYRRDDNLCISGGLADFDFGHWSRHLEPGEAFEAPRAYLTAVNGSMDDACQRLTGMHERSVLFSSESEGLPVLYNEFCSSWGNPSEENIIRMADRLCGKGIDYFVIDAGWYAAEDSGWENNMGDWIPSEVLFPHGMRYLTDHIRSAGMKPGIWFEPEIAGKMALADPCMEHRLRRNGKVIRSGERSFWDFTDRWTGDYLKEKVIRFLKEYGFEYIKIDYNESAGIGCDGAESLGEGLYEQILAVKDFFREIRREVPDICMELCSSGGHRLEPSMLELFDMASFSDAHEQPEIPVIAAGLHRVMRPDKCQIWSVLRRDDSADRICYSMSAAFLGVMCLSGDMMDMSGEQWELISEGIRFYHGLSGIIRDGMTYYFGTSQECLRRLSGWQGILRKSRSQKKAVIVLHCFEQGQRIAVDLGEEYMAEAVFEARVHDITIENRILKCSMNADEGMAILLQ